MAFSQAHPKGRPRSTGQSFCKHIRIDADQDKVLHALESDADFDPELYEHVISETGAEINYQHEKDRHNYIKATLTQERLEEIQTLTEQYAKNIPFQLSAVHEQASRWVSSMAHSANDYKDIMDITERDLLDFKNACLSLEGARKEIGAKVLTRLDKQYNKLERTVENVAPRILLLPAPNDM